MPIQRYNRAFTKDPRKHGDAAQKVLAALIQRYGPEKGKRVFYGMVGKARRQGRAVPKPGS